MAGNATGSKSLSKHEQTQRQLQSFLGEAADLDLLNLVIPEFVEGYLDHLFTLADKETNPITVDGWFENLHRLTRSAIRGGFLPDIDVFPAIRKANKRRLGIAKVEDNEGYRIKGHDFKANIAQLLQTVADEGADLRMSPTRWNRRSSILLYVMALGSGGVDIADILSLKRSDSNTLAGNGFTISPQRNPLVARALELFNGPRYTGDAVLNLPDSDDLLARINAEIAAYLKAHDLQLFRAHNVMTDLLGYQLQAGMKPDEAIAAVRQYLTNCRYQDAGLAPVDADGAFAPAWRVLCSYRPGQHGIRLAAKVADLKMAGVRTYAPEDTTVERRKGRLVKRTRPGLGRYLFVYSNARDAAALEAAIPEAAFMRSLDNRRRMATVDQTEILRLRSFLHDYRDLDLDLVDPDRWLSENQPDLAVGRRVRILSGAFAGYEGIVVSRKDAPMAQLMVRLATTSNLAVAANISLALTPFDLADLPPNP